MLMEDFRREHETKAPAPAPMLRSCESAPGCNDRLEFAKFWRAFPASITLPVTKRDRLEKNLFPSTLRL